MKKISFFYVLIIGLIINFTFNGCKEDPIPPPPPPNDGLESKSFIVEQLKDSVAGYYKDNVDIATALECSYILRNKTNDIIEYNVSIERVQAEPSHSIIHCIVVCISPMNMTNFFDDMGKWTPGFSYTISPNAQTNPKADSYIKMWTGNEMPGVDKLKITYSNANDPTDFVYFTLTFNFFE